MSPALQNSIRFTMPAVLLMIVMAVKLSAQVLKDSVFFKTPVYGDIVFDAHKPDSIASSVFVNKIYVGRVNYADLRNIANNGQHVKEIWLNYYEDRVSLFCVTKGFEVGDTLLIAAKMEGLGKGKWYQKPAYRYRYERFEMLDDGQQIMEIFDFRKLPPGKYVFHVRVRKINGNWKANEGRLAITVLAPFWQTWWFWLVTISGVAALVAIAVKIRVSAVRKEERLKAGYEKQALELEAKALRAQMDPHFIFNCMNSIKSLIQQKEGEKAVTYLTTFSKLLRTILEHSDQREISLFDEVETCRLYTQLESMRFGNKCRYTFFVDESIDLKSIRVPALIIQPFIENAIWHGIMPKPEGGTVTVSVVRKEEGICCIVEDDGIGRKQSVSNKSVGDTGLHVSKGIRLTQARLSLDNMLSDRNASIETVDKKDIHGSITGTIVFLCFNDG